MLKNILFGWWNSGLKILRKILVKLFSIDWLKNVIMSVLVQGRWFWFKKNCIFLTKQNLNKLHLNLILRWPVSNISYDHPMNSPFHFIFIFHLFNVILLIFIATRSICNWRTKANTDDQTKLTTPDHLRWISLVRNAPRRQDKRLRIELKKTLGPEAGVRAISEWREWTTPRSYRLLQRQRARWKHATSSYSHCQ